MSLIKVTWLSNRGKKRTSFVNTNKEVCKKVISTKIYPTGELDEISKYIAIAKIITKELITSKKKCRDFLVEGGFCTKTGRLTKWYRPAPKNKRDRKCYNTECKAFSETDSYNCRSYIRVSKNICEKYKTKRQSKNPEWTDAGRQEDH